MHHVKRFASIFKGEDERRDRKPSNESIESIQRAGEGQLSEGGADRPLQSHPFTEIQVLPQGAVVTAILAIDCERIASATVDGVVTVWNVVYGIRLHVLKCHSSTITLLSCLRPTGCLDSSTPTHVLVSASADMTMAFWDAARGGLPMHTAAVADKTISCCVACHFPDFDVLITGGNALRAWSMTGRLMASADTKGGDITALMAIEGSLLVVSDKCYLDVYQICCCKDKVEDFTPHLKLSTSNQAVTCMVVISDEYFAYGCDNGLIHVRGIPDFDLVRELNCATTPVSPAAPTETRPTGVANSIVRCMNCTKKEYLIAAVGCDFVVVHLSGPIRNVIHWCHMAHSKPIRGMDITIRNDILVTCGSDGAVKLWDLGRMMQEHRLEAKTTTWQHHHDHGSTASSCDILLGECYAHSGSAEMVVPFSDGFVSFAEDKYLITWKDPVKQHMRRSALLASNTVRTLSLAANS